MAINPVILIFAKKKVTFSQYKNFLFEQLDGFYTLTELKIIWSVLVYRFCGLSHLQLMTMGEKPIHDVHFSFLNQAVKRMQQHEPLEYVTGEAQFLNLRIWVNPSVLIPRPETEELFMIVKEYFSGRPEPMQIIDLGTGSGCIAIALKSLYTNSTVAATDIDPCAVSTARFNANLNRLDVKLFVHDMLNDEELPVTEDMDVIVSNPPYVLKSEQAEIKQRVKNYEPHLALFAKEENPLKFYSVCKDYVFRYLKPGGLFVFEINENLNKEVFELFQDFKDELSDIEIIKDSFGKHRFVKGVKRET